MARYWLPVAEGSGSAATRRTGDVRRKPSASMVAEGSGDGSPRHRSSAGEAAHRRRAAAIERKSKRHLCGSPRHGSSAGEAPLTRPVRRCEGRSAKATYDSPRHRSSAGEAPLPPTCGRLAIVGKRWFDCRLAKARGWQMQVNINGRKALIALGVIVAAVFIWYSAQSEPKQCRIVQDWTGIWTDHCAEVYRRCLTILNAKGCQSAAFPAALGIEARQAKRRYAPCAAL